MRRSADPRYTSFLPLKSMTSQLSLEKKINVSRQKLIENERNEILKLFNFFQKKRVFFKFWKSPKKTAPGAVFSGDFQNLQKKMDFFLNKWKFFKTSFLSFSMSFSLVTLIFFPVKAETPYFWMVRSLCSTDQQIVAFKASKCFRKVEKSVFLHRFKNRRI